MFHTSEYPISAFSALRAAKYSSVGINGKSKTNPCLSLIENLINTSCLSSVGSGKASKFTATEDIQERMQLIDSFNKGYIEYLVAIRCLDEGINIPSIKSALILSSNDNYREFVQRRGRILRL